ncbi:hypothetical protein NSA56_04660 [Oceanobacillus caeni]|uniref:hypothetical protein n=1 Tax=Oceanobacillus TaxID=182709 RepID=UPI0006216247|nr:hypothetical protein [Oceanobacillus caeni]KKE78936.1 membrane protein [Bacilli bacterium VT-13-104]PZD86087.1 hypothetical protein DEJ64_08320 [Bacilli bacterium]MBU8792475.1 hypothetical protein [Oceanobacillus caeni]MCR1833686.1 hypothetical protein [Oceanobacillus caeni]PZD89386.1 hypothetical protein DEJ60_05070 [Bacilli bacterium]
MDVNLQKKSKKLEAVLWSIALPGFYQLLRKQFLKGFLLVLLEFLINVMGNFNRIIILSFNFRIEEAIQATNYQWLLFYPCLYFFGIWDAYKDASGEEGKPFAYLPLVFSAYFVTVGVIFSTRITIFGHLIGPMWSGFLFLPIGLGIGAIIRWILIKIYTKNRSLGS